MNPKTRLVSSDTIDRLMKICTAVLPPKSTAYFKWASQSELQSLQTDFDWPVQQSVYLLERLRWRSIAEECPPLDGSFFEMRGDSGMIGTPYRIKVVRYEGSRAQPDHHDWKYPTFDDWAMRDHSGDHLSDDGEFPTHWRYLTTMLGDLK